MRLAGAIDIGGTATKIGIVAEDGSVVKSETIPTSPLGEPIALVDAIVLSPCDSKSIGTRSGTSGHDSEPRMLNIVSSRE